MSHAPRRLLAALGASAVLVAAGVAVSASGGTTKPTPPTPPASATFRGIPERAGVLGDPKAPLTLTEYVDLQCPICAEASKQTLPTLIDDYVRTGKVKLQARTLHFIGPASARAARAAAAAQEQGKLWAFVEAFYAAQGAENSGYVTDGFLRDVAEAAGADPDKVVDGTSDQGMTKADAEASRLKVDSTPTFTVTKQGKTTVIGSGVLDASALEAALR